MSNFRRVEDVPIPKPCAANWDDMEQRDGIRFCESCNNLVHDLSILTHREASKLLREGGICARVKFDHEGRILYRRASEPRGPGRLFRISVLGASVIAAQADAVCADKVKAPPASSHHSSAQTTIGQSAPGIRVLEEKTFPGFAGIDDSQLALLGFMPPRTSPAAVDKRAIGENGTLPKARRRTKSSPQRVLGIH